MSNVLEPEVTTQEQLLERAVFLFGKTWNNLSAKEQQRYFGSGYLEEKWRCHSRTREERRAFSLKFITSERLDSWSRTTDCWPESLPEA